MQKFQKLLIGRKTRKFERDELNRVIRIQAIIDLHKFSMKDISAGGFALINEPNYAFEIGKSYKCSFTLRGEPRLTSVVIVRRVDGNLVGFEVMDKEVFNRFIQVNLKI